MSNYLTIPGFESLTQQEIFDLGLAHIRKTRTKGIRGTPEGRKICSYQGSGCVASVLLREEARKDADTHGSWSTIAASGDAPSTHRDLIGDMQEAHDDSPNGAGFMAKFEHNMCAIAKKYNLSYEPEVPA